MIATDNIATVKAIYEAFGQGDAAAILEKLTDDVDWSAEAASDTAPWWGKRSGKEAVGKFFEDIGGAVDVQEFTPLSFAANDTDRFEDGKVAQYRGTEDTEQTAAMLAG